MRSSVRASMFFKLVLTIAVSVVSLPAATASADLTPAYRYWLAHPQSKVLPTSPVPAAARTTEETPAVIAFTAAAGEAEARQIVLRPGPSSLRDVWIQPSDLSSTDASGNTQVIPASSFAAYKVGYVKITTPSAGSTYRGLVPDPLLPMTLANGQRLGWQPDGSHNVALRGVSVSRNQPFYLRLKVPDGAVAGTYTGTVSLSAKNFYGAPLPSVTLPITVRVYPFSVADRHLKTAIGWHGSLAAHANSASHKWLSQNARPPLTRVAERTGFKGDQMGGWLKFMSDNRLSPQFMVPAWENGSNWAPPADDGRMIARREYLDDYLQTGQANTFPGDRFRFNTVKMPEYGAPSYAKNPFASSAAHAAAVRYYATMRSELGTAISRAYVYPIDEPPASKRAFIEKFAAFTHKYIPGAKFLVTIDASTCRNRPIAGVDIYVHRLHFFFRDASTWIKTLRSKGKGVWIYSHATRWQKGVPNFTLDESLSESRSQGWFAWRTRAGGLLYFSVNAWRYNYGAGGYRDPYLNTANWRGSYNGRYWYANGDGILAYPGYYPRLGLHVEGAPPVGSLRMEALRDGLEDFEYVRLISKRFGTSAADKYAAGIIGPTPSPKPGSIRFPPYKKDPASYERVRRAMAERLSR